MGLLWWYRCVDLGDFFVDELFLGAHLLFHSFLLPSSQLLAVGSVADMTASGSSTVLSEHCSHLSGERSMWRGSVNVGVEGSIEESS